MFFLKAGKTIGTLVVCRHREAANYVHEQFHN